MKTVILSLTTIVTVAGIGGAQPPPTRQEVAEAAAKYVDALEANRKAMQTYSWNYRIQVTENDVIQWVDLVNIQIRENGPPILTQVNREQIVERNRGLFGKPKQEKGFEQKDQIINYVTDWIVAYNRLPANRIHALFEQAVASNSIQVAPGNPNIIGVTSKNVRDSNANDEVTLWFNIQNHHPVRFAFQVPVEKSLDGATGEFLKAVIDYRYLANGEAFYPKYIDFQVPSRGMQVRIENLNMAKKL